MGDLRWLETRPALEELTARFPREWHEVRREVEALLARDNPEEVETYILRAAQPATQRPGGRVRAARERANTEARRQMTVLVLKRAILRSSTGVQEGRIRFGLVNGYVAQKLLFRHDLVRKPVPLWLFRLVWPRLTQRRLLMPLVQPQGIWCFYSRPLIRQLAEMIGDRSCLEIAAGDGTLSAFLTSAGVRVIATDDYSWSDSITFPTSVQRQDARAALQAHRPEVVICSWPPAGNTFERYVFKTASVELYIVISSSSELSTGNWADYRRQSSFAWHKSAELSRMVLPPEVDHGVYIFTRRV